MQQRKPHLPIGYWLKKADEVLTARINEAQEANGLNRTEWQILNTLHEVSSHTRDQIAEILRPFVDEGAPGAAVERLAARGLIEGEGTEGDPLRLTDQGRLVHRAALETQKKIREQAVRGISEAEYATTVQVLQRLVANLTGDGP